MSFLKAALKLQNVSDCRPVIRERTAPLLPEGRQGAGQGQRQKDGKLPSKRQLQGMRRAASWGGGKYILRRSQQTQLCGPKNKVSLCPSDHQALSLLGLRVPSFTGTLWSQYYIFHTLGVSVFPVRPIERQLGQHLCAWR